MTWREKAGLALVLGAGLYVWFAHPALMAAVLLVGLVFSMLTLAVMAMMRRDRRKAETKSQRVLRIVNEQEPRWHYWR